MEQQSSNGPESVSKVENISEIMARLRQVFQTASREEESDGERDEERKKKEERKYRPHLTQAERAVPLTCADCNSKVTDDLPAYTINGVYCRRVLRCPKCHDEDARFPTDGRPSVWPEDDRQVVSRNIYLYHTSQSSDTRKASSSSMVPRPELTSERAEIRASTSEAQQPTKEPLSPITIQALAKEEKDGQWDCLMEEIKDLLCSNKE